MENNIAVFGEKYLDTIRRYAELERSAKEIEEQKKNARAEILEAMDKCNIRSFENDILKLTVVAPSVTTTIDTKALRMEDPDTYDRLMEVYPKTTERRQSLRVTLR